jgi:LmbE family N-acetylglucosaminyl deacetylase
MLDRAKNIARRLLGPHAKAILRGHWYPILLPHHHLVDGGISTLGGPIKPKPPELLACLKRCDGTRTLSDICADTGMSAAAMILEEESDILMLWPEHPHLDAHRAPVLTEGIILSPHLDDAALSMGSAMLRAGARTPFLVIDVFSTVSWWRFDLNDGILPRVQTTRDAEEERVMRLTNAKLRRWGLSEAPLRGYPVKEIFTAERKSEAALTHETIRRQVCELAVEKPGERWFLPLAIGNHIDHRIARDAALDGLRDANVPARQVSFYEDLPYAAQEPGVRDYAEFLSAVMPGTKLRICGRTGVQPIKQRLLRLYYSQLTRAQIDSVLEYAERIDFRAPCERIWTMDQKSLEATEGKIPAVVTERRA